MKVQNIHCEKNNTNRTYELFSSGIKNHNTYSGTGIAIQSDFRPCFKQITDRISTASFQLNDKTKSMSSLLMFQPTLEVKKSPRFERTCTMNLKKWLKTMLKTNTYFSSSVISMLKQALDTSYTLITLANKWWTSPEYTKENNLILTKTLFCHKLSHRTTWTFIERVNPHLSIDGTVRRNPYRNQIDYIVANTSKAFPRLEILW